MTLALIQTTGATVRDLLDRAIVSHLEDASRSRELGKALTPDEQMAVNVAAVLEPLPQRGKVQFHLTPQERTWLLAQAKYLVEFNAPRKGNLYDNQYPDSDIRYRAERLLATVLED